MVGPRLSLSLSSFSTSVAPARYSHVIAHQRSETLLSERRETQMSKDYLESRRVHGPGE